MLWLSGCESILGPSRNGPLVTKNEVILQHEWLKDRMVHWESFKDYRYLVSNASFVDFHERSARFRDAQIKP